MTDDTQMLAAVLEQEIKDVSEGGNQAHFQFMQRKPDHRTFGLIKEEDLAAALGVEPLTMARWRRQGEGPAVFRKGKTIFYQTKDVYAWFDANTSGGPRGEPRWDPPAGVTGGTSENLNGVG